MGTKESIFYMFTFFPQRELIKAYKLVKHELIKYQWGEQGGTIDYRLTPQEKSVNEDNGTPAGTVKVETEEIKSRYKIKKEKRPVTLNDEIHKHRTNIKEVMLWSNATPIRRLGDVGYKCCYCEAQYLNPANLKKHTLESHQDIHKVFFMKYNMDRYVVRLDITALQCKICDQNFDTLNILMEHLKNDHKKKIYSDIKSHIISFKFDTETPQCCICMATFSKYKLLVEHMNVHYRNYVCEVCDLGFVNSMNLTNHKLTHKIKSITSTSKEVTLVSLRGEIHKHRSNIKEIMLWSNATPIRRYGDVGYMCSYCEQQHVEPAKLKEHTLEAHKNVEEAFFMNYKLTRFVVRLDITSLRCKICNEDFNILEQLMEHLKVDHQKPIYTDIKNHIIPFKFDTNMIQCCICTTTFSKYNMLVEHMNIHYSNYICDVCNDGFVNSISFTNHKLTHKTKCSDPSKEIILVSMKGELHKHRSNIKEVMLCSNATPIRRYGDLGYQCCYCEEQFLEPAHLKKHTLEVHKDVQKAFFMKLNMTGFIVRLDITSLQCNICEQSIETVEELMEHLKNEHKRNVYTDIRSHITPLKFDTEILQCCICMKTFSKFKLLLEHMNIHYRNYICQICDIGFTYSNSLRTHIYTIHNNGNDTAKKKTQKNTANSLTKYLNKCGYCNETFNDYRKKEAHLVSTHGLKIPTPKCQACDKVFKNRRLLNIHVRKDHLMEREFKCSECEMSFFRSTVLKKHMVKHTGLRSLMCSVCSKVFGRAKSLKEHMKIHDEIRRFKCDLCGQLFVQKCSWRGHMKSKHGEIV